MMHAFKKTIKPQVNIGVLVGLFVFCALSQACGDSVSPEPRPPVSNQNNARDNNKTPNRNNDPFVPEEEKDYEFTLPAVVDGKVYVANETLNTVAVIDSATLSIKTVNVGFRPTQVVGPTTLDAQRARITVLNEGSSSVTIIDPQANTTITRSVMPNANSLTASPAGDVAVAWYDDRKMGPVGDLSSISVVKDGQVFAVAVGFHVTDVRFSADGQKLIVLSDDGVSIIATDQINGDTLAPPVATLPPLLQDVDPRDLEVILDRLGRYAITRVSSARAVVLLDIEQATHHVVYLPEVPTDIDVIDDGQSLEALVMLRNNRIALRMTMPEGFINAAMLTQPVEPTDPPVDMSADMMTDMGDDMVSDMMTDQSSDMSGDMMVDMSSDMVIDMADQSNDMMVDMVADQPGDLSGDMTTDQSNDMPSDMMVDMVADMAQPSDMNPNEESWSLEAEGVTLLRFEQFLGAAVVSGNGKKAILYTTIGNQRQAILYHLDSNTTNGLFLEKGVRGITADVEGKTFILFHNRLPSGDDQPAEDRPSDPEFINDSYGLSVVDVASATARLVLTEQEPRLASLWSHPQTDPYVYVIFETPELIAAQQPSHRDVLVVNLRSFRIDSFRVPSLTQGIGVIPDALRVYISQRHPQGRMTFVDVLSQRRQTITGYQLNAGIE